MEFCCPLPPVQTTRILRRDETSHTVENASLILEGDDHRRPMAKQRALMDHGMHESEPE